MYISFPHPHHLQNRCSESEWRSLNINNKKEGNLLPLVKERLKEQRMENYCQKRPSLPHSTSLKLGLLEIQTYKLKGPKILTCSFLALSHFILLHSYKMYRQQYRQLGHFSACLMLLIQLYKSINYRIHCLIRTRLHNEMVEMAENIEKITEKL